jgi:tetratricopeptide (TPR) repeat protein
MTSNLKIIFSFLFVILSNEKLFSQKTSLEFQHLAKKCSWQNESSIKMAIDYYSKAIELDTNCSVCYEERALRKNRIERNIDSVNDFYRALLLNPNCSNCFTEIAGYQNEVAKKYSEARQNYFNALKVLNCQTPQDYLEQSSIIQNIGYTYNTEFPNDNGRIKGRKAKIAIYDSLIQRFPRTEYFEERAHIKSTILIGDYKGALDDYMLVYNRNKNTNNSESSLENSGLLWSIAICNNEIGNFFEAIQYYNRVIELEKKGNKSSLEGALCRQYYQRGESKMNLEDYRGAIADFKLALSVHKNFPRIMELYTSLGKARLLLGDFQNSLADLNKAIELSNDGTFTLGGNENSPNIDLAYTYYLLGFVKMNLQNKDGACKAWSKSGEFGYSDAYTEIKKNCN